MKGKWRAYLILGVLLLGGPALVAQVVRFKMEDRNLQMWVDRSYGEEAVNSALAEIGTNLNELDSIGMLNDGSTVDSWNIVLYNSDWIILEQSIDTFDGDEGQFFVGPGGGKQKEKPMAQDAIYGVNQWRSGKHSLVREGEAYFFLPGHLRAREVYLSGSFVQWATRDLEMDRTEDGWKLRLDLPPGKHSYKFIVDGKWEPDPMNQQSEADGHWGKNSIIYIPNRTFRLEERKKAKKVYVSGSFNDWREKELLMRMTEGVWELPIYLSEGTWAYKFIVDGEWILDPSNSIRRSDGEGNMNSVLSLGEEVTFKLRGFEEAEEVFVTGDFNAWRERNLPMKRTAEGWVLPYVVGKGNHQYKFIVDGEWIIDPDNPVTIGWGDYQNSVFVVGANYHFEVLGFENVEEFVITGDFSGFDEHGFTAQQKDGAWILDLYLKPGKYRYKLRVDGEWVLDPGNPLYEENEYGTGNSIIWIE
jgi:hypothetical protein